MINDFVTFNIAKKLEKKGFNKDCISYYTTNGDFCINTELSDSNTEQFIKRYACPTIYHVLKWLRVEKDILIKIGISYDTAEDADGNVVDRWTFWLFEIFSILDGSLIYTEEFEEYNSYEEAACAGIEYVLDNIYII